MVTRSRLKKKSGRKKVARLNKFIVSKKPSFNFWHEIKTPNHTKEEALRWRKKFWNQYHRKTRVFNDRGKYKVYMRR